MGAGVSSWAHAMSCNYRGRANQRHEDVRRAWELFVRLAAAALEQGGDD